MRIHFLALFLVVAGCAQGRVLLPSSDEAMACNRQCMSLWNTCDANVNMREAMGDRNGALVTRVGCNEQNRSCLMSCPGACVEGEQEGSCAGVANARP